MLAERVPAGVERLQRRVVGSLHVERVETEQPVDGRFVAPFEARTELEHLAGVLLVPAKMLSSKTAKSEIGRNEFHLRLRVCRCRGHEVRDEGHDHGPRSHGATEI